MMRRGSSISWFMTVLALGALALGMLSLPEEFSQSIRLAARDISRPGQTVTRIGIGWGQAGWQWLLKWQARQEKVAELGSQLQLQEAQLAEYRKQLTQLRQELHEAQTRAAANTAAVSTDPLFVPEFIKARVLGQETVALAAGRKLLNTGTSSGVGENLLVVEPGAATLDVGSDLDITIHQQVFSGDIVLGRTAICGRFSCTLQPVTDAKFQGPAQLLHKAGSGFQPGAEGVLEGTGRDLCRLTGIWRDAAVEVGDEVYTPAADPLLPHPMFYGRVVRVKLEPGMSHWEIDVEPASKKLRPTFVQVVRPRENALRTAAN